MITDRRKLIRLPIKRPFFLTKNMSTHKKEESCKNVVLNFPKVTRHELRILKLLSYP